MFEGNPHKFVLSRAVHRFKTKGAHSFPRFLAFVRTSGNMIIKAGGCKSASNLILAGDLESLFLKHSHALFISTTVLTKLTHSPI